MAAVNKNVPKVAEVKTKATKQPWENHLGTKSSMVHPITPEEVMLHLGLVSDIEYPDFNVITATRAMSQGWCVTLEEAKNYKLSDNEQFVLDVAEGRKLLACDEKGFYWTTPNWVDTGLLDPNRIYHRKIAPTPREGFLGTSKDMLVHVTEAELADLCIASAILESVPAAFIEQEYTLDGRTDSKYSSTREAVERYSIIRAKDDDGYYWTLAHHVGLDFADPWRILNRHAAPAPKECCPSMSCEQAKDEVVIVSVPEGTLKDFDGDNISATIIDPANPSLNTKGGSDGFGNSGCVFDSEVLKCPR